MNSRVLAAVAAAVLAVVGIGALVVYAAGANSRAYDGATMIEVYRVTEDINANANADEVKGNVEKVRLPNAAIAKGAIKDLSEIKDLRTTVPLIAGEQLVIGRFAEGGSSAVGGSKVPKGLQEISLELSKAAALAGNLTAGQHVGVIVLAEDKEGNARARMISQNVLVTGVESVDGSVFVTLATNGHLATQISGAALFGQVRLTAQNDDTDRDGGKSVEVGSLVR